MSTLSTMWIVMLKELRDIGRDRRTLALTLLLGPLLFPALILGMGALAEKRAKTQIDKVLEVPVIGMERAPNLVAFLATQGIKAVEAPADLEAALREQRQDVGLRVSESFAEDYRLESRAVRKGDTLKAELAPGGGWCAIISLK